MDNILLGDPWIYAKMEMEIFKFAKLEIFQTFIYFSCEIFNFRATIFLHFRKINYIYPGLSFLTLFLDFLSINNSAKILTIFFYFLQSIKLTTTLDKIHIYFRIQHQRPRTNELCRPLTEGFSR